MRHFYEPERDVAEDKIEPIIYEVTSLELILNSRAVP
jgi:hypothetical protein